MRTGLLNLGGSVMGCNLASAILSLMLAVVNISVIIMLSAYIWVMLQVIKKIPC